MSKALSRRSRDFFRGNPKHLFAVTRFGAPVVYVRAGSSHLNGPGGWHTHTFQTGYRGCI
jgi:hypothetical protein